MTLPSIHPDRMTCRQADGQRTHNTNMSPYPINWGKGQVGGRYVRKVCKSLCHQKHLLPVCVNNIQVMLIRSLHYVKTVMHGQNVTHTCFISVHVCVHLNISGHVKFPKTTNFLCLTVTSMHLSQGNFQVS